MITPSSPPDLDSISIPDFEVQGPFPAPSEPLQYRAIGIVRGRYEPSEDRITQGTLRTSDGVAIDAVLLGRVLSLVRKHLDLAEEHPWVVYPRTREGGGLHTQIVGVWSLNPEGLKGEKDPDSDPNPNSLEDESLEEALEEAFSLGGEDFEDDDFEEEEDEPEEPGFTEASQDEQYGGPKSRSEHNMIYADDDLQVTDGFFSIRGEISFQSQQEGFVLVKIRQQSKKKKPGRSFKLRLEGFLPDDARGKFWDFEVQRNGEVLEIEDGTPIATLQKRLEKRRGGAPRRPSPGGRMGDRGGGLRPRSASTRPEYPEQGLTRPERPFRPITKPVRPPSQPES
ncbi:MAG: hypothetical protein H7Y22_15560 [Gemmatimonadaceae bacterium]|nr:hypothetical protein [Gloeobacterales cyanobacterium ES-bin-141]